MPINNSYPGCYEDMGCEPEEDSDSLEILSGEVGRLEGALGDFEGEVTELTSEGSEIYSGEPIPSELSRWPELEALVSAFKAKLPSLAAELAAIKALAESIKKGPPAGYVEEREPDYSEDPF